MAAIHDHLDAAVLEELRAVLEDDFPSLVSTFLIDSDKRLAALRSGLATGDASVVREAAHSFKGSSLNIGAHRLAALCLDAETRARAGEIAGMAALLDDLAMELRAVASLLDSHRI